MKSLPLKLTIFVFVLFALVIATCLLWTPLKIQYYVGKLKSDDPKVRVAAVDGLLAAGEKGKRALISEFGNPKEAKFLISHWRNILEADNSGWTPIQNASANGYRRTVELLIEKGADYICAGQITTPLLLAAEGGHFDILKLLLDRGLDVNVRSSDHTTALHEAAMCGHNDIVKFLCSKGANVNVKDIEGCTPIHNAAECRRTDVVAYLISRGANVNVYDRDKRSPLHLAACPIVTPGGNYTADVMRIVSLLIEKGAHINHKMGDGRTPLDFALIGEDSVVIDLLRAHGGKTGEEIRGQENKKTRKK